MNRQTFKDVVAAKRSAFINDVEDDEDDDAEISTRMKVQNVEGEEDGTQEAFNDVGEALEPFNLRGDREEGHFDENMNFVFKKEHSEVDAWLASMDEASMEKSIGEAALAKKREDAKAEERTRNRNVLAGLSSSKLKQILLEVVQEDETVKQALNRLSTIAKPKLGVKNVKAKEKSLESNGALDRDTASKKLSRLIEVADTLVSRGFVSIYEASYESIVNSLSVWEYQALDGSIQGPFTSQQIADWMSQGYFTGDSAVMIRRCGLAESHRPLISSGASESLATKRKQMDEYIGPTKKVKFDLGVQSTKEDLLADLDDDDDDGNDNDTDNNEVKAATKGTIETVTDVAIMEEKGPWILSDDIDFRELASSSSSPYPSTELLSSATSSNTESYSSSSSEARKEALRRQMEEDADDDDDEDIDDDFEVNEGRTDSRHKRKPANKDDGDDSD